MSAKPRRWAAIRWTSTRTRTSPSSPSLSHRGSSFACESQRRTSARRSLRRVSAGRMKSCADPSTGVTMPSRSIVRPRTCSRQSSSARIEPGAVVVTPCFSGLRRSAQKSLPQAPPDFPEFLTTLRHKVGKITIFTPLAPCAGDLSRCKMGRRHWSTRERCRSWTPNPCSPGRHSRILRP
jgi:hypothetical protein